MIPRKPLHVLLEPCGDTLGLVLPPDDGSGPVFPELWQAEVLATTVAMSQRGVFSWKEWVECFSAEITTQPQRPDEDANAAYYRQWLAALERMLCERGLTSDLEVAETTEHWRRSYLHTEHGRPVQFRRDLPPVGFHDHDHHHGQDMKPAPVAVSHARTI